MSEAIAKLDNRIAEMIGKEDSSRKQDGAVWIKAAEVAITATISIVLGYYSIKLASRLLDSMDGKQASEAIDQQRRVLAAKLNRPELLTMDMNAYEARIVHEVLSPAEIGVSFGDIGGMGEELSEVQDNVVLPMHVWRQFGDQSAAMMSCPAGVLLYGKPGTGKTLTAKALASEAGATFINVKSADLMDKWLGESDKLVLAVFSLARKLAPSIIFIDEIDTMLRRRENDSQGAITTMQGTLLAEWDGIKTHNTRGQCGPVVVLGATNRPMDLDGAILRRMPVQVRTRMPDQEARADIISKLLLKANTCPTDAEGASADAGVPTPMSQKAMIVQLDENVKISEIAKRTEAYSGSDLKELVRVALLQRTKRMLEAGRRKHAAIMRAYESDMMAWQLKLWPTPQAKAAAQPKLKPILPDELPISAADFEFAFTKALPTGTAASDYNTELMMESAKEKQEAIRKALKKMQEEGMH